MEKEYVLFHLKEAQEELTRTIQEIERDPEYDYGEFYVAMQHLYHHVNTAWNARDASPERTAACSKEDFEQWRRFPEDFDMCL